LPGYKAYRNVPGGGGGEVALMKGAPGFQDFRAVLGLGFDHGRVRDSSIPAAVGARVCCLENLSLAKLMGTMVDSQRRIFARSSCDIQAELHSSIKGKVGEGRLIDIGLGGAQLQCQMPLQRKFC